MRALPHGRGSVWGLPVLALLASLTIACQTTPAPPPVPSSPAPAGTGGLGPVLLTLSGPVPGAPGTFLYAAPGGLHLLEPSTKASRLLTPLPSGTVPATPAVSPDGKAVAFSLYKPSGDGRTPGGTDLLVINRDGSGQRTVQGYDAPLASLTEAAWSPDGKTLYYTYRGATGAMRVERTGVDGSNRATVVDKANSPTISPHGKQMAFIRSEQGSFIQSIWVAAPDGSGERRIIAGDQFDGLGSLRFSPDSQRLLFAAVGGPGVSVPPASRHRGGPLLVTTRPSGVATGRAEARTTNHGVPWDLWTARSDGTDLKRLTELGEDSPIPAWSPDGKWIAFSGELGIYLMKSDGKELVRLSDDWVAGGMTWLP